MERRKLYLALGIATLVLALSAAGLTIGIFVLNDHQTLTGAPYTFKMDDGPDDRSDGKENDTNEQSFSEQDNKSGTPSLTGTRDPPSDQTPADNASNDGTPWYVYAAAAFTIICVLAFVAVSGRAYAESSRQESIVRNDLVDLISFNPGINLSSIRNELQLSQGAVSYHLRRLEKGGIIYSHKGLKERRYYPATMGFNQVENRSAADEVRSIIANPTGARIVDILGRGDATQSQIVGEVGVSPSTVHWHMDRMEKVGIIKKRRDGRTVVYRLNKALSDT